MKAGRGIGLVRVCTVIGMALAVMYPAQSGLFSTGQAATLPAQPEPADVPVVRAAAEQDCTPKLGLASGAGAMIAVSLSAPCRPDERVVLRHAGLAVTYKTDQAGKLAATLPALKEDARVSVLFAGGQTVGANLPVPDAAQVRRFGVQWPGRRVFGVNAFEGGAAFGAPEHVSAAQPGKANDPGPASQGFLTVLGDESADPPILAEVYTFPGGTAPVPVVVEAAITAQSCGQELLGETLHAEAGQVELSDLTVTMPACDGTDGYLLLENLLPDRKAAVSD